MARAACVPSPPSGTERVRVRWGNERKAAAGSRHPGKIAQLVR